MCLKQAKVTNAMQGFYGSILEDRGDHQMVIESGGVF